MLHRLRLRWNGTGAKDVTTARESVIGRCGSTVAAAYCGCWCGLLWMETTRREMRLQCVGGSSGRKVSRAANPRLELAATACRGQGLRPPLVCLSGARGVVPHSAVLVFGSGRRCALVSPFGRGSSSRFTPVSRDALTIPTLGFLTGPFHVDLGVCFLDQSIHMQWYPERDGRRV